MTNNIYWIQIYCCKHLTKVLWNLNSLTIWTKYVVCLKNKADEPIDPSYILSTVPAREIAQYLKKYTAKIVTIIMANSGNCKYK